MYKKLRNLEYISRKKIIAVIRATDIIQAKKIAEACINGGIKLIEITMTIPNALSLLSELCNKYNRGEDVLIGAGTVLDAETARACIFSNAEFIVCPIINEQAIKLTLRYGKIIIPGTFTLTEIIKASELGGDIIKYFPGSLGGPKLIEGIKKVLPEIPLCPTGGIDLNNIDDWIKSGAEVVGIGSQLTKGAEEGNFKSIEERAKKFVEKLSLFEHEKIKK